MAAAQESGKENVRLHAFTDLDRAPSIKPYIVALEAFDALAQLQEMKALARERAGIGQGAKVLDVGCGFGLESLRLARLVQPGGTVAGIDKSADFIKEAKARARQAGLAIEFQVADAEDLPFADAAFDVTRAERVLVYLPEPKRALQEMRRVTRPGGTATAIEPDFGTNAINFPDRALVRRILDHECDANIPHGLLARDLRGLMQDAGFRDITIDTRIVIFTPDLAAAYFTETGRTAQGTGVIDEDEFNRWASGIDTLRQCGRLFASVGYYLFTARV
jgi:SAM-dependent methyltransferase